MLFPSTTDIKNEDEEWNYGFWGEHHATGNAYGGLRLSATRRGRYSFYELCCFWIAVILYVIVATAIFFAVDLVFTQFGVGIGLVSWTVFASPATNRATYNVRDPVTIPVFLEHLFNSSFTDALLSRTARSTNTRKADMALYQPGRHYHLHD
jgi:hypothetical protein